MSSLEKGRVCTVFIAGGPLVCQVMCLFLRLFLVFMVRLRGELTTDGLTDRGLGCHRRTLGKCRRNRWVCLSPGQARVCLGLVLIYQAWGKKLPSQIGPVNVYFCWQPFAWFMLLAGVGLRFDCYCLIVRCAST